MISSAPKILFVCYDGFRTTNARVRCYRFSEQLRKNGLDSAVFSFKDNLGASHDGEESYRVGFFERLSLLCRATSRLMKEDSRTVLYVQKAGYFALAPLVVHFLKGNRLILDYDDYEYEQSWLSKPLLRALARNSVFCVAASHHLQQLLSRYSKRVYYIPTGVDTDVFRPRKPKPKTSSRKPIVFTWIGIIVDRAALDNVLMILDAFLELEQKGADFRLEIVGGGDHMREVEKRIRDSGSKKIIFRGRLPPADISSYLDTADAGLFVLAKDTKYNRSKSPTKLFEYLAKGLAVIATPVGEAGYVIMDGENGLIAGDKKGLMQAAKRLISDNLLRQKLGRNALASISSEYNLNVLGKRLAGLIKSELGGGRR